MSEDPEDFSGQQAAYVGKRLISGQLERIFLTAALAVTPQTRSNRSQSVLFSGTRASPVRDRAISGDIHR